MIRDYTIHLRVEVKDDPANVDLDLLDGIVRDVVIYSTAREAIETGLDGAQYGKGRDWREQSVESFYVVSATKPKGAA